MVPSAISAANVFIPGVLEASLTCCDQAITFLVVVIIVPRIVSITFSTDGIPHYINLFNIYKEAHLMAS